MDYNKTINLPKTDFPMRAGLPKREPEMLKRWEDMDLYNELREARTTGKPRFSPFTDGPPDSANGSLHMATPEYVLRTSSSGPTPCVAGTPRISPAGITTVCPSRAPSSRSRSSTARP